MHVFLKMMAKANNWLKAEGGVAAVEFALIMPLLLTLYLGTVEASRALSYDRRMTFAASTLGDLVAQSKNSISTSEITEYFKAAELTLKPYDGTGLQLIVSSIYVDASGNSTVSWSRSQNTTAHVVNAAYVLPTEFTDITRDSYVIVAEAAITYSPLTSYVFNSNIPLYKEYFYVPRFGSEIACDGC